MLFKDVKQFEDLANYYIDVSCREVCKLTDLHDFDLAFIKLDWSKRRASSRGGWYPDKGGAGVSIAMSVCSNNTKGEIIRVYEYKAFDPSPIIGGFYTRNVENKLAMHCLHEVAHAAQYWGKYLKKLDAGLPHGDIWRGIYSHLRSSILNSRLEDQTLLAKEYNKIIESIESPLQRKLMVAASR